MRKHLLRFFSLGVLLCLAGSASAQLVGGSVFLQGRWLEVGQIGNGAFGTCTTPAGYHQHNFGAAMPSGTNLAMVYDYGHDGWTAGAPVGMGDYTIPGTPFEGWEMQINGLRNQAFQGNFGLVCPGNFGAGGGSLTGSNTGYINAAGRAIGTWQGTAAGGTLEIYKETRVDTLASWVVVTARFRNIGVAAVPNVFYLRTCDPDNDQSWPGGGFFTNNTIVHQNQDARHRVMVSSQGNTGPMSYMALGTKDCRAKCFIYGAWPLSSTVDLSSIWNQTYAATYNLGATANGDIGIGLLYNLGTIAPGDSSIISYAYIFNGNTGIDSAFPDPQIKINGVPKISWAPPTPNYDTFDACLYPGLLSIPVDIMNVEDKCWSWSKWTWAPATGLATTTGAHNVITFSGLPPTITYTITGTDSSTGMYSCNQKIFYLTIHTCNGAEANNPCIGDTLFLNAPGDSLGATYQWYGPAPSTTVFASTQAYSTIATLAHSGTYTVIKTVGGLPDTSTVDVTVFDIPRRTTLTSNQPDCAPVVNPLTFTLLIDSVTVAWTWTGPGGFTSNLQNPTLPFDSALQGKYYVTFESVHGCIGQDSIVVKPGPVADFTTTPYPGCPKDSLAVNNLSVHGMSFEWDYGDGSKSFDKFPTKHAYTYVAPGTSRTVILKVTSQNGCMATKTVVTDMRHEVIANFDFVDDTICNTPATPVVINDLSTASQYGSAVTAFGSHLWEYSTGHTDNTNGAPDPSYVFPEEGFYTVKLTVTDTLNCESTVTKGIYVLQPYIRAIHDSTFCLTMPMRIRNEIDPCENCDPSQGFNYLWAPDTDLSSDTAQNPYFTGVGNYTYTLTATMAHEGCVATHVMNLNSTLPKQILNVTEDTKINYGESIQLYADNTLYYTWGPEDGSLSNTNINNPIATPTVTTTYAIYGMDFYGCRDTAYVTIVVDSTNDEFIPTGFTPNGDGLNDVFRLKGSKFHSMVEFRVYNRYGQQVFYTNVWDKGWDGTFNGKPADMGVYHYTVIVARKGHANNEVLKGDVTLIR